jgi:4-amino-4-deoxy-L-arabinose transferase-like glycosyltransferase
LAAACGVLAIVVTWFSFGGLNVPPGWHDEAAYLLQARLFAHGSWAAPAPPLPEFFEQFHVLVTPSVAAKYPPGQALFLMPGVAIGRPGLMVLIAASTTAILLFSLVNKVANRIAASGAVLLWLVSAMAIRWRSSYMSEVLTGLLWLAGLMLALRWWQRPGKGVSVALGAVVGAMAITRPITALAFAIPLGICCGYRAIAAHRMREALIAVAATVAMLTILPIWAQRTTGKLGVPPVSLYTAQYMPWDRMGFGLDTATATRDGPPEMAAWAGGFRELHAGYTLREAGRAILLRVEFVGRHAFWRYWVVFAILAAVGCVALRGAGALAAAQGAALFLFYGFYAHFLTWDVYYFELLTVVCGCVVIGVAALTAALARWRSWPPAWQVRALGGTIAVLGTLMLPGVPAAMVRSLNRHDAQSRFLASLAGIETPSIVFVKNGAEHDVDAQLVGLLGAPGPTWIVHDLAGRNVCLAAAGSGRRTYLFDEATGQLSPIQLQIDTASLNLAGCP